MPIYQTIEHHVTKHSILGIIYTFPQSSPENTGQIPNTGPSTYSENLKKFLKGMENKNNE
jgi:hypothetical protein